MAVNGRGRAYLLVTIAIALVIVGAMYFVVRDEERRAPRAFLILEAYEKCVLENASKMEGVAMGMYCDVVSRRTPADVVEKAVEKALQDVKNKK